MAFQKKNWLEHKRKKTLTKILQMKRTNRRAKIHSCERSCEITINNNI